MGSETTRSSVHPCQKVGPFDFRSIATILRHKGRRLMGPRLILVGGFLGAGKTTLLLAAARLLAAQGQRVGLVLNDQSGGLVDWALAQRQAIPVEEVADGCFCCRFPDLTSALRRLRETAAPTVIFAEPVGSCTDLMATVLRPLLAYHAEEYELAPLTVLIDPLRQPAAYTDEVAYLHRQQLAEAEIVLLSKADLLSPGERHAWLQRLTTAHAPTPVGAISAAANEGVAAWLAQVLDKTTAATGELALDYSRYAAAEAQLGWLNAGGVVESHTPFQIGNWLTHLLRLLEGALTAQGAAIAHLKLYGSTAAGAGKASLTSAGGPLVWDLTPPGVAVTRLEFLLNARVHTTPALLERAVRQSFAEISPTPDFRYEFTEFACFQPPAPTPTYRLPAGSVLW
jgi:G3E family GTPase